MLCRTRLYKSIVGFAFFLKKKTLGMPYAKNGKSLGICAGGLALSCSDRTVLRALSIESQVVCLETGNDIIAFYPVAQVIKRRPLAVKSWTRDSLRLYILTTDGVVANAPNIASTVNLFQLHFRSD